MENPMVLRPNEFCIPINLEMDLSSPPPSSDQQQGQDQVDNIINNNEDELAGFSLDGDNDPLRGRSADIKTHLEDLARRHPDLADQLRGFPGGSDPVFPTGAEESSTPSSSSNNPDQQPQQQQPQSSDTQSNNSGGATEGDLNKSEHFEPKIGNLQNHGLRNTVPLVEPKSNTSTKMSDANNKNQQQQQQPNQDQRNSRAQSAPPQSNDGQRFVSKIEINPVHNIEEVQGGGGVGGPAGNVTNNENQAPQGQTLPPHNQNQPHFNNNQPQADFIKQPHVKQPNVRHIPIFVEGRDVPIVNRDHAPPTQPQHHPEHHNNFDRFYEPPIYEQREPEHFYQDQIPHDRPFGVGVFDIPVHHTTSYRTPNQFGGSTFSKPKNEKVHNVHSHQQQPHQQQQRQQQQQEPQIHKTQNQYQQSSQPPPQQHHQQQQNQNMPPQATAHAPSPPPKKISRPKTHLEQIQEIQAEVEKLRQQIEQYKGTTRKDKEYIYLDEMLTRELLKLDNIDSMGNEEIRNLRRSTIKSIQATIASLEAKVPLGDSTATTPTSSAPAADSTTTDTNENNETNNDATAAASTTATEQPMEIDQQQQQSQQDNVQQQEQQNQGDKQQSDNTTPVQQSNEKK